MDTPHFRTGGLGGGLETNRGRRMSKSDGPRNCKDPVPGLDGTPSARSSSFDRRETLRESSTSRSYRPQEARRAAMIQSSWLGIHRH